MCGAWGDVHIPNASGRNKCYKTVIGNWKAHECAAPGVMCKTTMRAFYNKLPLNNCKDEECAAPGVMYTYTMRAADINVTRQ